MGLGYKGGATHYHMLAENKPSLSSYRFNENTGYFGEKGKGGSGSIRNISSENPEKTAKEFYESIAYGGIERPLGNGEGVRTEMKDGTIIVYRKVSHSDGTSAVSINVDKSNCDTAGIKTQKIHFVKE